MVSNETITIFAFLSVTILCIFLSVMFYQLNKQTTKKKLPREKSREELWAHEVSSDVWKQLKSKLFTRKEFALITIALAIASSLTGINPEMTNAIVTVDGFMISFTVISWSILIPQVAKQSYRDFRDRLGDLAEDAENKELLEKIAKEGMPGYEDKAKAFMNFFATPFLKRAFVGKIFPQAIVAFVISIWSSLILLGFRFETTSPIWYNVYDLVAWLSKFCLMFGIYLVIKVFSLSEEILLETNSYFYYSAMKKLLKSTRATKQEDKGLDSKKA